MNDIFTPLRDIFELNKRKNFWDPYTFALNSIKDNPVHAQGLRFLTAKQFMNGVIKIRDEWEKKPYGLVSSLGSDAGFERSIAIRELIRHLQKADSIGNYDQYIDNNVFDYILQQYGTFSERAYLFAFNSPIASIATVGSVLFGFDRSLGDDESRKLDSYFVQHSEIEVMAMSLEYSTLMAWLFFTNEAELTDRERVLIATHFNYNTNFGAGITPEMLSKESMSLLARLGKTLMREGRDLTEREKKSVEPIVKQIYPE